MKLWNLMAYFVPEKNEIKLLSLSLGFWILYLLIIRPMNVTVKS